MRKKIQLFLILALLLCAPAVSFAKTVWVTNADATGTGSLAGVITASTTVNDDTIKFDTSTWGDNRTITVSASIALTKSLVIDGEENNIILSGNNSVGIFSSGTSNRIISISNLTFRDGNRASGGAISFTGSGNYTFTNVRFLNNNATTRGGAISSTGTLTVNNCYFSGNKSTGSYGGGAISTSAGTIIVSNSIFENNSATTRGGAISGLNITVTGSVFKNNTATTYGGAIAMTSTSGIVLKAKLLANTFIGNSSTNATNGGGVFGTNSTEGNVLLAANIFQNNTSASGAAYNEFYRADEAFAITSAGYNVFKGAAVPADTWTSAATDAFDVNEIVDIASYHVYPASVAANIIPANVATPLIEDLPWPATDVYGNPTAYGTATQHAGADQTVTALQGIIAEQPEVYQNEVEKNIGVSLVGTPALSFEDIGFVLPSGLAFTEASAALKEGSIFSLSNVAVGNSDNGTDTRLQLTVNFAPAAEQEYTDTLTISAAGAYDFVIPLRGTGISWTVAPVELQSFGDIYAGYSSEAQTLTVTGSNASGAFSYSLKSGQTAVFPVTETEAYSAETGGNLSVRFAPQTAIFYRDTLVISSAGSARTYERALEGNGLPRSVVTSDPASIDFGRVVIGMSKNETVTVTLADPVEPLTASDFSLATGKFAIVSVETVSTASSTTADAVEVTLSFTPQAVQEYLDTLIVRAAYAEEYCIPLSGVGFKPVVTSDPASLDFGWVVTGASKSATVTVTLTDPVEPLTESAFSLAVAAEGIFEVSVAAVSEAPAAEADVVEATIVFYPQADVDYLDTLVVRAGYADEYRIPLSGTGDVSGWSDNPLRNDRITFGRPVYYEFETFKDGSARFVFLSSPNNNRGTSLQTVDNEGVKLFPDTGKLITRERTWSTVWVNDLLFVDNEGNSIIAASDLRRTDGSDESYTLYKVSPTGESLWNENGIDLNRGTVYGLIAKLGAIQLEDSSYVFTWMSQNGSDRNIIELQRLSKNGEFLWENNVVLQEGGVAYDNPRLVNAGNNQFTLVYTRANAIRARKFDSAGASLWTEDANIYSGADFPTYAALNTIINVAAGPEGSVFVGWYDFRISGLKETPYIAHVKADGSLGFLGGANGERLSYSEKRVFSPKIVYDAKTNSVYAAFRETNDKETDLWLVIQKIALDGDLSWGTDGIRIDSILATGATLPSYAVQPGGEGRFAVFYLISGGQKKGVGRVALIDGETGGYVWENEKVGFSTVEGLKSNLQTGPPAENRSWVVSWEESRGNEAASDPSIYVQRINFDGSLGKRMVPPCAVPFGLEASGITSASAILSWDAADANVSWDLRYGIETNVLEDVVYTFVDGLTEKSYLLQNLEPETAYVWGVRASCEEGDPSDYVAGDAFSTLTTGIGTVKGAAWSVFASGKIINILNPSRTGIDRIRLYDLNGALLKDYRVQTNENVLITARPDWGTLVVRVEGNGTPVTSKVIIKRM
ncbi:MAG: hypothetical protein LBG15_06315 [Dysgonamonadaceae bacterium]|jgi:predicted outer membrane repeat protein|nr:hypothetical protein [Dysgonamonadaceae bacterium]